MEKVYIPPSVLHDLRKQADKMLDASKISPHGLEVIKRLIDEHNAIKEDVLKVLQDLADKAEGLVIEKIEAEWWSNIGTFVGRGIVIVSGLASLCLAPFTAGASIAGGGVGIAVGYLIIGGSKVYEL